MTTLIPDTLDYLVALFKNAASIGGAGVEVIDGPMPNSGSLPLALWVGVDDVIKAADGEPTTAAESQQAADDFSVGRSEVITVHCTAAAWTGETATGYSPLRAQVKAIVQAVEAAVVADTNAPAKAARALVDVAEWQQRPVEGIQVFVPFQIIYKAL